MTRSHLTAAAVAFVAVAGCAVSPQPEPVRSPLVDLDVRRVVFTADGARVRVTGGAGAMSPGPGELVVVDLDSGSPSAQGPVAADGSFEVSVDGTPSDVLRLVGHVTAGWSAPLDVTQGARETLRVDFRGGDCLTQIPPASFELGGLLGASGPVADLALDNHCSTAARVTSLALRAGDVGFAVGSTTLPLAVAAGTTATVEIRFDPPSAGIVTDVLYVGVDGAPEPIPVSLLGSGPAP